MKLMPAFCMEEKHGLTLGFCLLILFIIVPCIAVSCACESCQDEYHKKKSVEDNSSGVTASKVNKVTRYVHIGNISVMCINGRSDVNVLNIKTGDYVLISDTKIDVYRTIGNAVKKLFPGRNMEDYYIKDECLTSLRRSCHPVSNCVNGNLSRADCQTTCNLYDIPVPSDRGNKDELTGMYGITIR